jgi:OmpR family response regulator RpaB
VEFYKGNILVVDSEAIIRNVLAKRLTILGYRVFLATNVHDAFNVFKKESLDLIVLGIIPPKLPGYKLCCRIRKKSSVPIIFLTTLGGISDRITGFDLGADDYLIKPFSPKELEARIRSILRRVNFEHKARKAPNILHRGALLVNIDKNVVLKNDILLNLTEIEFRLFELLVNNPGKILSRKSILERIWGYTPEREIDTRIVDVHISRLRAKLEDDLNSPNLILTVRKAGYMFQQ